MDKGNSFLIYPLRCVRDNTSAILSLNHPDSHIIISINSLLYILHSAHKGHIINQVNICLLDLLYDLYVQNVRCIIV